MATRPGELLAPADLEAQSTVLTERFGRPARKEEVISSWVAPESAHGDFCDFLDQYGCVTALPTRQFWYGMQVGDTINVELGAEDDVRDLLGAAFEGGETKDGESQTLSISTRIGPLKRRQRELTFLINGTTTRVVRMDDAGDDDGCSTAMADPNDPLQLPSPLPGTVDSISAQVGGRHAKGDCLMIVCAMKMEVKVTAPFDLVVESIEVDPTAKVEEGSLVARVARVDE